MQVSSIKHNSGIATQVSKKLWHRPSSSTHAHIRKAALYLNSHLPEISSPFDYSKPCHRLTSRNEVSILTLRLLPPTSMSTAKLVRCRQAHTVCVTLVSTSLQPKSLHCPFMSLSSTAQSHLESRETEWTCEARV